MPGMPSYADLVFKAVPVNRAGLGQLVLEDDPNLVALRDLDRRAGRGAVEPPDIDRLIAERSAA